MCPVVRIALAVAVLVGLENVSYAQVLGGFGQRQSINFQVRNGPGSSFSYQSSGFAYGYGPYYGPYGYPWYYGRPGVPVIVNPIVIQQPAQQPPVIVQNIINQAGPPAGELPAGRGPFLAPEAGVGAGKMPAAKPNKPAARAVPPGLAIDPPKVPPLAGRVDSDRLADAGRRAFAEGQYGRALELFRRAAEVTPDEASLQYLIAQAQFALGKYAEAVDAIAVGVKIRPDWSDARYVSRDLYWKKPELYDDHMKALRQAVAEFPNDARLAFLLGHQLWFDGMREDARQLFQKVAMQAKGQTPADSFTGK